MSPWRIVLSLFSAVALLMGPSPGWAQPSEPKRVEREHPPRKWGLLVGVNEYVHLGRLNYCSNDMAELRAQLVSSGFGEKNVYQLHSAAERERDRPFRSNIEDALDLLLGSYDDQGNASRAGLVEEGDLVVLAFGGHGVHWEGKSYLCPTDARLDRLGSLIPVEEIYSRLAASPAAMKLLLIDACRNDPRPAGARSVGADPSAGFAAALREPPKGVLVLASCSPGEVSWEEAEFRHGVFMHFLLEGLRGEADRRRLGNKDDSVSFLELFRYVNEETREFVAYHRRTRQTPQMWGELAGDFEIARVNAALVLPQPEPRPVAGTPLVPMGSWPLFGGTPARNGVPLGELSRTEFDPSDSASLRWRAKLGSVSYGSPVVHGDKLLVGTNNAAELRAGVSGDRGVLAAFDAADGSFLWQLTRDKLPTGRANDWPMQGICSTPCAVGNVAYVVTNRCELMCLDLDGFRDGENDGPYRGETYTTEADADIVWLLDMIGELGVHPHNMSASSPVVANGRVFVVTGNGVDESHVRVPAPAAPALVAVEASTGRILWSHKQEGRLLHGQWSSPAVGVVGRMQEIVVYGAGDGWLYALDTETGELVWKFDCNLKESKWVLGGRGTRNNIIAVPVLHQDRVYVATGQDPEHGEGEGRLWCVDATRRGDISAELGEPEAGTGRPNPNSGVVWVYDKFDRDGDTRIDFEETFHRSISTVAITGDLLFAADFSGVLHCLDRRTGRPHWTYDCLAAVWSSPVVMDGKVLLADEDGDLAVFSAASGFREPSESVFENSIYATPVLVDETLYVVTRNEILAFWTK